MPYTTQTSEFWGWFLRHNTRTIWSHFADAGLDYFADGPSQNPQAFLDLTNLLPAMSEGFFTRWGVSEEYSFSAPTWGVSSYVGGLVRTFVYNYPQDASNPGSTATTNIWLATDNQNFFVYNHDGSAFAGLSKPTNFASAGSVYGTSSRGYFYYSNGESAPRKVNPSYTAANTDSLIGIAIPTDSTTGFLNKPCVRLAGVSNDIGKSLYEQSSGYGYTTTPTCTISDPVGSGTGATISLTIGANGEVNGWSLTSGGTGYSAALATITAPPIGGVQANLVLYVQTNPNAPKAGQVVGADFAGPMSFVSGRRYAVALQNSKTGHTSDYTTSVEQTSQKSGQFLDALTADYDSTAATVAQNNIPVYAATPSSDIVAGFTQVQVVISVPAGVDPQVDTVVLLAGADGQADATLYEVVTVPLSSFTLSNGFYEYYYLDILPDSYNTPSRTGTTLLDQDIWAETDAAGAVFGIALNAPPPNTINHLTPHQGRLFGTDGKTLFYSKSLDEVTTSTGLITSKWEECWPGDYQLPVALENETIIGLRSDGTNLHIGTDKSIFTLYGSDPDTFSIPAQAFAQTGILSPDCWTVVYAEGIPAGFVWITQDYKVMHSDFSTYREIGTPIYPNLQGLDPTRLQYTKVNSLTYGPYNLVIIEAYLANTNPEFYIWETRLQKWYRWTLPNYTSPAGLTFGAFVYQYPSVAGGNPAGSKFLYFWRYAPGAPGTGYLCRFDPAQAFDSLYGAFVGVAWSLQTSWQDLGDATSIKVINEVELLGSEAATSTVVLYGASSQSQFSAGGVLLKSGAPVQAPISSLGVYKLFCAGTSTAAKFYSVAISNTGSASNTNPVLTGFSLESYPMARI